MVLKGVAILTEARSGSNWLGSLANGTGVLGQSDELLDPALLGSSPRDMEGLVSDVVAKGSTPNGRFAVKIFPRHLMWVQDRYDADFIATMRGRSDLGLVLVKRRDRLGQAISLVRSMQTGKWTSASTASSIETYSFKNVGIACLKIERAYAFWEAYLHLHDLEHEILCYEDLVDDPSPYVAALARHLDVPVPAVPDSTFRIQRDAVTEEWRARYKEDLHRLGFLRQIRTGGPTRNLRNLVDFFRKKPMSGISLD